MCSVGDEPWHPPNDARISELPSLTAQCLHRLMQPTTFVCGSSLGPLIGCCIDSWTIFNTLYLWAKCQIPKTGPCVFCGVFVSKTAIKQNLIIWERIMIEPYLRYNSSRLGHHKVN